MPENEQSGCVNIVRRVQGNDANIINKKNQGIIAYTGLDVGLVKRTQILIKH